MQRSTRHCALNFDWALILLCKLYTDAKVINAVQAGYDRHRHYYSYDHDDLNLVDDPSHGAAEDHYDGDGHNHRHTINIL